MDFLRLIGICLIGAGAAILLFEYKKEFSAVLTLSVGATVLISVIAGVFPYIAELASFFKGFGEASRYFTVAMKAAAIGAVSSFAADTCRDFGQSAIAAKAELVGKAAIFIVSVPALKDLFEMLTRIM